MSNSIPCHVDSTSNHYRSTTDDDSLDSSLEEILATNEPNPESSQSSASETLAELFMNRRRLKEAETQVCSLSLILQNSSSCDAGSGIADHAVFRENKSSLEDEVIKMRQEICEKELFLKQRDADLYSNYLRSFENDNNEGSKNHGFDGKTQFDEDLVHDLAKQSSGEQEFKDEDGIDDADFPLKNAEFNISDFGFQEGEFDDEQQYFESSPNEVTKLRRTLNKTRRKHKEERDAIMKQLRALQITTVNGETNWRCILKKKQIEIDELSRKNDGLQARNKELNFALKNIENLKHKEAREKEKRVKKNSKIIASLRNQVSSSDEKINELLEDVKKTRNINQELNGRVGRLDERNKELEKCLGEKDEVIQSLSKEIQDTNCLVNKLIIEVNCVSLDNESLTKQIEELETENKEGLEDVDGVKHASSSLIHVGLQTEECSSPLQDELSKLQGELASERKAKSVLFQQINEQKKYVECLRESEVRFQNESEKWKSKSFQNERTIQELIISLGKATTENKSFCERNLDKHGEVLSEDRKNLPHFKMLKELKSELSNLQKDIFKNKENLDSLRKTWRKYETELKSEH
ncbi:myosin type-2 heavy chain 1-like [Dendronephthya gigantea]|uniref:myosin type-2 heavy chain 1-like n=1 Tax=Dendronephthya gigantea TaxID=151771 RepID=UPI001069FBFD|nr:myosin type-2 heavy chain 1-like [Dendronephthya gigantea]